MENELPWTENYVYFLISITHFLISFTEFFKKNNYLRRRGAKLYGENFWGSMAGFSPLDPPLCSV